MIVFSRELSSAIREDNVNIIRTILDNEPEQLRIFTPFARGTWLHYAAGEGKNSIVKEFLDRGLDVNEPAKDDGRFPIVDAALYARGQIVRLLLERGALLDVNASSRNSLFAAIAARSIDCARLLIDAGIDTRVRYNSPTMIDMDAVAFAMMEGPHDIARLIALHNADGDVEAAERAMAEGLAVARRNTRPVPPGEDYAPS